MTPYASAKFKTISSRKHQVQQEQDRRLIHGMSASSSTSTTVPATVGVSGRIDISIFHDCPCVNSRRLHDAEAVSYMNDDTFLQLFPRDRSQNVSSLPAGSLFKFVQTA
jgi:hypothetical protein